MQITVYGAGCALAALCGLLAAGLALLRTKDSGATYDKWITMCVFVIPLGWLMSRLFYVASNVVPTLAIDRIMDIDSGLDLKEQLLFWHGGYSLFGAVIGSVLGAAVAERVTHTEKGVLRDALAIGLPVMILIQRVVEHATNPARGRPIETEWLKDWSIWPTLEGEPVHLVFLYQAFAALVLLIVMLILTRPQKTRAQGEALKIFLLLYGLTQVLLESLRDGSHMTQHFVHVEQVLAIILAVAVMIRWSAEARKKPGRKMALLIGWIGTFLMIGLAVAAEFGVDRWGKPFAAYGLMAGCLIIIGLISAEIYHMAKR